MHGIETGCTGYLCPVEGCSTQTRRYADKQALLHGGSAVSVLPLAWTALGVPHSSGTKGQDTGPSLKALCMPLHAMVWQCSDNLSVACWVLEVPTTVLGTDTTADSKVVVVWFL